MVSAEYTRCGTSGYVGSVGGRHLRGTSHSTGETGDALLSHVCLGVIIVLMITEGNIMFRRAVRRCLRLRYLERAAARCCRETFQGPLRATCRKSEDPLLQVAQ